MNMFFATHSGAGSTHLLVSKVFDSKPHKKMTPGSGAICHVHSTVETVAEGHWVDSTKCHFEFSMDVH